MKFLKHFLVALLLAQPIARAASFVNDTFTDTDGTNLTAHTGETGATWTNPYGGAADVKISSGRIYANNSNGVSFNVASGTQPSTDCDVLGRMYVASVLGTQSLVARATSDFSACYRVAITTTGGVLYRSSGYFGTNVTLGTFTKTWVAGSTYAVILRCNSVNRFSVLIDGAEVIAPVIDGVGDLNTHVGILSVDAESSATGFQFTQFSAGPVGSFIFLTPGTVTITTTSDTAVSVSQTAASSGTATFSYQLERAPDVSGSPGTFVTVGSAQSGLALGVAPSAVSDTGLTTGNLYWYRSTVTDGSASTASGAASVVLVRLGKNYYVSAAGNDSNDGLTTGTPWLTKGKVEAFGMVPGDTFNFRGGDTFTGSVLHVTSIAQPTAALPITVQSYGTGQATFSSGTGNGIQIKDVGYVVLYNFAVNGSGSTLSGTAPNRTLTTTITPLTAGVDIDLSTYNDVYREGIVIDSLTITNCYAGIQMFIFDTATTAQLSGTRITHCVVHDCVNWGIATHCDVNTQFNRNVRISDCVVYNIYGQTTRPMGYGAMGFGIYIQNGVDCVIERCVAHNLGECMDPTTGAGVEAFMFVYSTRCTFRACEGYNVYSTSGYDSNGFEFDTNCTDCVTEYCYAHDTAGSSAGIFGTVTGGIFRYNVFVSSATNNAGIFYDQGSNPQTFYQNTLYFHKAGGASASIIGANVVMRNNILVTENGGTFGTISGGASSWTGNLYRAQSGSSFSLSLGGVTYTSLAAMQAAGYEVVNGLAVGATGDPVFTTPGDVTVQMPANPVSHQSAYDLGGGSAARSAGADLLQFQIDPGFDWHANAAVAGSDKTYSGLDAGAVRYGSTAPTPSTSGATAVAY